jgi:hypothetical protein
MAERIERRGKNLVPTPMNLEPAVDLLSLFVSKVATPGW